MSTPSGVPLVRLREHLQVLAKQGKEKAVDALQAMLPALQVLGERCNWEVWRGNPH